MHTFEKTFRYQYGSARIRQLDSNVFIGVVLDVFIQHEKRGMGYGTEYHLQRLKWAKADGKKLLLCTVNRENLPELAILKKFGWKKIDGINICGNSTHDGIHEGHCGEDDGECKQGCGSDIYSFDLSVNLDDKRFKDVRKDGSKAANLDKLIQETTNILAELRTEYYKTIGEL